MTTSEGLEGINNERFIVAEKDSPKYDLALFKKIHLACQNMSFQYFVSQSFLGY